MEDSVVVDGRLYRLVQDTSNFIFVVTDTDTSLLCNSEAVVPQGMELVDMNRDGRPDVRVGLFSNTPGLEQIYLFDTVSGGLKRLRNALDYYNSQPLIGTPYCMSYNRAGCADFNWESWLFGIEGDSAYALGHMVADQCPATEVPMVRMYCGKGETEMLLDSLPGDTSMAFFARKG